MSRVKESEGPPVSGGGEVRAVGRRDCGISGDPGGAGNTLLLPSAANPERD